MTREEFETKLNELVAEFTATVEPETDWSQVPAGTPVEGRDWDDSDWCGSEYFLGRVPVGVPCSHPFLTYDSVGCTTAWKQCRLAKKKD